MPTMRLPDPACGIFETMLVVAGRPIELQAHLSRLSSGAQALYGRTLPPAIEQMTCRRAAELQLGRLRLAAKPVDGGGDLSIDITTAAVDPLDLFPGWQRAIRLRSIVAEGWVGAQKWVDRSALQELEAELPEGTLALLIDTRASVLEVSRANLFAAEDGVLLTPPLDGRILPGIARAQVIHLARALGVCVREEALALARLAGCREAFLTGSVRGVEPVASVDARSLAPPGELVEALADRLRREWMGAGAVD